VTTYEGYHYLGGSLSPSRSEVDVECAQRGGEAVEEATLVQEVQALHGQAHQPRLRLALNTATPTKVSSTSIYTYIFANIH
jgi:hypothetical protein